MTQSRIVYTKEELLALAPLVAQMSLADDVAAKFDIIEVGEPVIAGGAGGGASRRRDGDRETNGLSSSGNAPTSGGGNNSAATTTTASATTTAAATSAAAGGEKSSTAAGEGNSGNNTTANGGNNNSNATGTTTSSLYYNPVSHSNRNERRGGGGHRDDPRRQHLTERFAAPTRAWRGNRDQEAFEEGYKYELEHNAAHRKHLHETLQREEQQREESSHNNSSKEHGGLAVSPATEKETDEIENLLANIVVVDEAKASTRRSRFFGNTGGSANTDTTTTTGTTAAETTRPTTNTTTTANPWLAAAPNLDAVVWGHSAGTASGAGSHGMNIPAATLSTASATAARPNVLPGAEAKPSSFTVTSGGGVNLGSLGLGTATSAAGATQLSTNPLASLTTASAAPTNLFTGFSTNATTNLAGQNLSRPLPGSHGAGTANAFSQGTTNTATPAAGMYEGSEPHVWRAQDLEEMLKRGAQANSPHPTQQGLDSNKVAKPISAAELESMLMQQVRQSPANPANAFPPSFSTQQPPPPPPPMQQQQAMMHGPAMSMGQPQRTPPQQQLAGSSGQRTPPQQVPLGLQGQPPLNMNLAPAWAGAVPRVKTNIPPTMQAKMPMQQQQQQQQPTMNVTAGPGAGGPMGLPMMMNPQQTPYFASTQHQPQPGTSPAYYMTRPQQGQPPQAMMYRPDGGMVMPQQLNPFPTNAQYLYQQQQQQQQQRR